MPFYGEVSKTHKGRANTQMNKVYRSSSVINMKTETETKQLTSLSVNRS